MSSISLPDAPPAIPAAKQLRPGQLLLICGGVFAILAAFAFIFPYTSQADATTHLLFSKHGFTPDMLSSWSRPVFKLLLVPPAMSGNLQAHLFMALITSLTVWQTIKLAQDLELPSPWMAAPFFLWQAMSFWVQWDTLSEMPMALGVVIAMRLWRREHYAIASAVIGMTPMLRPEGFVLGLMAGCLILVNKKISWGRKLGVVYPCLGGGLLAWVLLCRLFAGDWLYILHTWNWHNQQYAPGPWWYYPAMLPIYLGGVPLFMLIIGLGKARRSGLGFGWIFCIGVFVIHSLLFWQGWMGSSGELRVLACTTPLVAVFCLYGWNRLHNHRQWRVALAVLATLWTVCEYLVPDEHYECFAVARCDEFIRTHGLLNRAPALAVGNNLFIVDLNPSIPAYEIPGTGAAAAEAMKQLPAGTICIWDDRQANSWHQLSIDQLPPNNFETLYQTTQWTPGLYSPDKAMRYIVMRKK